MEILFYVAAIALIFSISLGVGGSTFALLNFFVALWDGKIDESEKRLMNVVYTVLRVAMVAILIAAILHAISLISAIGFSAYTSASIVMLWLIIAVLYFNAIMMTLHKMPMTIGAGLQAGSWYSLGFLSAFISVGLVNFSFWLLLFSYILLVAIAITIVNVYLGIQKKRNPKPSTPPATPNPNKNSV